MRQIAQYQDGRLELQEVPRPTAPPGGVVVRTTHSVISIGTEKMKVEQAKMNLLQKARARPDQVRKVLDTARTLGWKNAWEKVRNRLETPTALGYSAAGVVVEVDRGNTRFRIGDRVACGGAECAFHAEYLALPDMLVARVPEGVENWQAAYTTLCSIALQAVRQTEPELGDHVLVMGQGLVGLLVTGLLRANGVRVMAVDLQPSRRRFAKAMGAERVVILGEQDLSNEVRAWTNGFGVDAAVICTATQSNAPILQAAEALRDRGRVVDVGNTMIELPWKIFYEKELEVRFSRAYGPGRYDPSYEWGGTDYPIGYVRWTEQRNFQACLDLMEKGQIDLGALTTRRVRFDRALEVYGELLEDGSKEAGVVLEYESEGGEGEGVSNVDSGVSNVGHRAVRSEQGTSNPSTGSGQAIERRTSNIEREGSDVAGAGLRQGERRLEKAVSRVDVFGAGNFARTMLLPHLRGKVVLGTVVNQTSLSANHVKEKFGFGKALTSHEEALSGDEVAGVLIATRHHLHARLVGVALEAGAHVFVEKPLCLTRGELEEIDAAVSASEGTVQVGFNRRFAPGSVELKRHLSRIAGPKSATYHVVAGKLDPSHWYSNYQESGGRVLGEACHFFDYLCFLFEARPVRVLAQTTWPAEGRLPFPDSVAAQMEFADGSCGQLIFTAEGDTSYPKETLRVFGAGLVAELTNFQKLAIRQNRREKSWSYQSKGHAEQMAAWAGFLRGERPHPLPYRVSRESMLLTFAALESIQEARAIDL